MDFDLDYYGYQNEKGQLSNIIKEFVEVGIPKLKPLKKGYKIKTHQVIVDELNKYGVFQISPKKSGIVLEKTIVVPMKKFFNKRIRTKYLLKKEKSMK
ncbi:hypothetical protein [Cohnella cholangitidis]|uniref:Uncharacterized protein n=1 Tax=Cohnella cholangitidis TaxID=2598458 RepID=A0A7G5BTE3_9BACL|nr:hypothetical protein [Cohnella cholangitidis]QMV40227.1 hypothetical protein FPL14_02690 [Cohnella cholangitidis]